MIIFISRAWHTIHMGWSTHPPDHRTPPLGSHQEWLLGNSRTPFSQKLTCLIGNLFDLFWDPHIPSTTSYMRKDPISVFFTLESTTPSTCTDTSQGLNTYVLKWTNKFDRVRAITGYWVETKRLADPKASTLGFCNLLSIAEDSFPNSKIQFQFQNSKKFNNVL